MGYVKIILMISALQFGVFSVAETKAEPETLSYVDESFFSTGPKLNWGRDPFIKAPGYSTAGEVEGHHKLEALIYSPDNPRAIVNGHIVKVGSKTVEGFEVQKIGPDYVVITRGTSMQQLTIDVRKPADSGVKK